MIKPPHPTHEGEEPQKQRAYALETTRWPQLHAVEKPKRTPPQHTTD